jgi:hypothetical protein
LTPDHEEPAPTAPGLSAPPGRAAGPFARLWATRSSLTRLELAAFVCGVVVRILTAIGFRPEWGFDFPFHLGYIQWVAAHWTRPDINFNVTSYHSPLYYFLAAPLLHLGAGPRVVQQLSVLSGCVRLGILWVGLRRFLPLHPWARSLALLLAGVLPASVQLDGQVANEALGTTLAAVAVLALPSVAGERPTSRDVVWFCGWLGLAVVTKFSYLLVGWVALPFVAYRIGQRGRREGWWPPLKPWVAGGAVFLVLTAPLFVVNLYRYGRPLVTAYDGPLKKWQAPRDLIPYFDRRTLGFYVAWDARIWGDPYYPTACCGSSRFFPVLTAGTFGDYLNYGFGLPVGPGTPPGAVRRNNRLVAPTTMWFSRVSVVAGSFLALVLAVTTALVARTLWRRRDPRLVLVLLPVLGVLGQLHFATRYATDQDGPIKGTYVQFAMLPAFALVGLAFEILARDPVRWKRRLAGLVGLAVLAVAVYTVVMKVGTIVLGA